MITNSASFISELIAGALEDFTTYAGSRMSPKSEKVLRDYLDQWLGARGLPIGGGRDATWQHDLKKGRHE